MLTSVEHQAHQYIERNWRANRVLTEKILLDNLAAPVFDYEPEVVIAGSSKAYGALIRSI